MRPMLDQLGTTTPAFPFYQRLARSDSEKLVAKFADSPAVQKEVAYFRDKVAKLKSVDDIFKDRRLLQFVLSAYSLESEIQYPARIKAVMLSKLSDPNALANRMRDPRYREVASELLLGDLGLFNLQTGVVTDKVVDRYVTNEYEKNLGKQNPALREAAYFKRRIASATSAYDILGDNVLRNVVTTTLGLPREIAIQSVEKQAALVERGFRLDKVKDTAYVDRFVRRFLIAKDSQAANEQGGGANSVLGLFSGSGRLNLFA